MAIIAEFWGPVLRVAFPPFTTGVKTLNSYTMYIYNVDSTQKNMSTDKTESFSVHFSATF